MVSSVDVFIIPGPAVAIWAAIAPVVIAPAIIVAFVVVPAIVVVFDSPDEFIDDPVVSVLGFLNEGVEHIVVWNDKILVSNVKERVSSFLFGKFVSLFDGKVDQFVPLRIVNRRVSVEVRIPHDFFNDVLVVSIAIVLFAIIVDSHKNLADDVVVLVRHDGVVQDIDVHLPCEFVGIVMEENPCRVSVLF